jgi:hypothetical protein
VGNSKSVEVMPKRKRRTKKRKTPIVHLKTVNFTLREFAAIMIYAQNKINGVSMGDAIADATELQKQLKQIRLVVF